MTKNKASVKSIPDFETIGTVIRTTGTSCHVRTQSGEEFPCQVKGNFRIKGIRTTNPVAVGDKVKISGSNNEVRFITEILPRKNYIIRRASNLSKESHILASNIDLALLIATVKEPATSTTFIDRFLATAEAYDVEAAIVINKEDTWDEEDREYAEALKNLYVSIGYTVLFVSALTGYGVDSLKDLLKNKTTLVAGNSGVGKSSLINAIVPGLALRTGDISDVHHTGMHTTTFSEMISLPEGGEVIDVPGVRGFGTIDFKPEETDHYFPEIFKASQECKYGDCRHTNEPGCNVKNAVENHFISESRYASYLSILEESDSEEGADKYRKPF